MFIVHAFINHAYNRDYEETYTIASSVDETFNPQLQLEVHQHDSEYIDGSEFNVALKDKYKMTIAFSGPSFNRRLSFKVETN